MQASHIVMFSQVHMVIYGCMPVSSSSVTYGKIRNLFENNPRYWGQNVFLAYEDLEKTSVHYYSLRFSKNTKL